MRMSADEARSLAERAFAALGYDEGDAAVCADHLVDAGLRGHTFGSLARVLAIAERMETLGDERRPISLTHETPVSALFDGGDNVGYVVAYHATKKVIEKALASGIAVVGANNTWYTGLFAYYLEMATRAGLVAMAIGNGPAVVAPHGSMEARLGTNPIAFGFPSTDDPVIWDIGTCAVMHGELLLRQRTGSLLPDGVAIDRDGNPTTDPAAALEGAVLAWGGHKGSGLSIVVQLLGAMCNTPVITPGMRQMGYLIVAMRPDLLMPLDDYKAKVDELSAAIRGARAIDPEQPVMMPFDRSIEERNRRRKEGIEVPDQVYQGLMELVEGRRKRAG